MSHELVKEDGTVWSEGSLQTELIYLHARHSGVIHVVMSIRPLKWRTA
jgi:hypothetical protein